MRDTFCKDSKARGQGSGFTLLEIMIALAIMGLTLSVVLHTVNTHSDLLYDNAVTTEMYQLAKEKMFQLEKTHVSSKGKIDDRFTFENVVTPAEDSPVMELKTFVRGHGREVVLSELVITEKLALTQ